MGGCFSFFSEEILFELSDQDVVEVWLNNSVVAEGFVVGEINYIFCSDEYLHRMNVEHLGHDTFTDIITFNYCVDRLVSTDVFISIDRVKENAVSFSVSFDDELHRVMIHGLLHLVGYDDGTADDKLLMRAKEDFYLNLRQI